jgi:hypothetical protein
MTWNHSLDSISDWKYNQNFKPPSSYVFMNLGLQYAILKSVKDNLLAVNFKILT